jgi:recombination protein RecT
MVRLVLAAASREPKLAQCTPLSVLRSLMQAAELGLEVCSGKNEGYLIPRYNSKAKALECTFLPGYQGLIRLAMDSGKVRNIEARVVYAKDEFAVEYGDIPRVVHKPSFAKDRGAIAAVYAVAFLPDGSRTFDVMPVHEVEEIRDRAKDKDGFSPWKTDFAEMARKTAVRRLAKYLPKSKEFAAALEIQAKTEAGDVFEIEADPVRPGDANPPAEEESTLQDNGDGERLWVWSEPDKLAFNNACDDMEAAAKAAGLTPEESDEKIRFYMDQRDQCVDSPEKVLNRMAMANERMKPKVSK